MLFGKSARKATLALVAALALSACDNAPRDLEQLRRHLEKTTSERQQSVSAKRPITKMNGGKTFYAGSVAWCGDSKTLISSGGRTALVWNANSGEMINVLPRISASGAIACDKRGEVFASGNYDKESRLAIRVWRLGNERNPIDIEGPFPSVEGRNDNVVRFLAFTPDNKSLLAHYSTFKGEQHRLVVYDYLSLSAVRQHELGGPLRAKPTISASGQKYAFGKGQQEIIVLNLIGSGEERLRFHTERLRPQVLAFGRDDKTLLVAGPRLYNGPHRGMPEHVIEEYSLIDGRLLKSIVTGHIDGLTALAFVAESGLVITASVDKTIEIRNASTGALVETIGDKTGEIQAAQIRPDGKALAVANGPVSVWALQ